MRFANGFWGENIHDMLGDELLFEFIFSTVKMLNSLGISKEVIQLFMDTVFNTLGEGIISAYTRASYATWPSYWSMVRAEDYEKAKQVIFGGKKSELRKTYAGLIAKLDRYNENVASRMPEIFRDMEENGTKVCIISKYGSQLFPYLGSYNKLSDQWVTLKNASFGATTAGINKTLSKSYIEKRNEEGLGKYISVDKQVDASTCLARDNTWIIKGLNHDKWPDCCEELAFRVCTNKIKDINSDPDFPQFLCYDTETKTLSPLTKDNMNCEDYYGTDTGSTENMTKHQRIFKKLSVFFDFLINAFKYLKSVIDAKKQ